MKTATISQAKNSLSALLDRVRHGESILITDRSRPVACLGPITVVPESGEDAGRLSRLERAGLVRRVRGGRLDEILHVPPPEAEAGGDVLAALLDERRNSR